jgi:hypothetical protein
LEVTGDLGTPGGISTQGSLAIDAGTTGRVDTQGTPWDISDGTLLIQAGGLDGGLTQTFAESLGLSLTENLGADGSSAGIGSVESLVIGSTPDTAYFLDLNTEFGADVFLIDSLSVQNKTISGNQAETLHVENRTGDISVNAPLDVVDEVFLSAPDTVTSAMRPANVTVNAEINAGSRVHIQAANDIAQGTFGPNTGLLNTSETVLQAGGSIGAIDDDQMINADTLAASAGTNLYVRNVGPELEIVSDSDLASVGASNDFRVRSDFNDLTVSTDINATNIALVTGTELDIAPQVSPADVILNNNINATGGNLVIVATGDIVQNAGTLSANQLGLGSPGAVGTTGSPISFTANDLALFSNTNNLNPTSPPNSVPSVTSVGVSVFSGSPTTPPVTPPITPTEPPTNPPPQVPVPEGSVVVDVVLEPFRGLDEEFDPSVFAQNNVGLIDDELRTLLEIDILYDRLFDPTAIPIGWWNDDDFLKRKFRRKSKK